MGGRPVPPGVVVTVSSGMCVQVGASYPHLDRPETRGKLIGARTGYCSPDRTDVMRWVLKPSQCMRPT
ncbi:hypothetical protein GCM10027203_72680 [Nonomuraea fastidiosa]